MHRTARLLAGTAVTAVLAAALTGCAAGAGGTAACTPQAQPGEASESVTAKGAFGSAPTVSFPTPMQVSSTQVSELIPGTGAPLTAQQQIAVDATFLNARTGEVVSKTDYAGGAPATFVIGTVGVTGLRKALVCARVGERLAAVLPPSASIPAQNRPTNLAATDSLVAVIDVRKAYLARADGVDQVMGDGLPAVVLGPDGRPGITLPQSAPPKTLQVADLKVGDGAVLKRGDKAVVQYTGVVWKPQDPANGTVFGSSWTTGAPATVTLDSSTVKGLVTALTGQRVGSQVLAILPPSEAYGDQSTSSVPAGATLVFVVDVLGKG